MKYLSTTLAVILLFSLCVTAQYPKGQPSPFSNGYTQIGYTKVDSGLIQTPRDTNWMPKYIGTAVTYPITLLKYIWTGVKWVKENSDGYFNVLDYGAIGSDQLNDSIGVKAAISTAAAKGGGFVLFPVGVYVMPPFKVPTGVYLIGQGKTDLPFFTGGDITQDIKGTVIIINGLNGSIDVELPKFSHNNGIMNMSVYNNNTASISSVVKVNDGNLYALFSNVEIGCTKVTSGDGLTIEGNTLYGKYDNVTVNITGVGFSYEASVRRGLVLHSLGFEQRPNANNFIGGDFRGAFKSLEVLSDVNNAKVQGVMFSNTTFESNYKAGMQFEYVAKSANIQELTQVDRYALKWITIDNVYGMVFSSCYYEIAGWPSTYNDGTHGVLPVVPVMEIGATVINLSVNGVGIIGHLYDKSYTSQTYNRSTYNTQNDNGEVGAFTNGVSSILYLGTAGRKDVGVRASNLIIKNPNTTWDSTIIQGENFQNFGTSYFGNQIRVNGFPSKQFATDILVYDNADGLIKKASNFLSLRLLDTVKITRTTGGTVVIGDSLNEFSIHAKPINGSMIQSELMVDVNGINSIAITESGTLKLRQVPTTTSGDYYLITNAADSIVKKVAIAPLVTATLDFPSTSAGSSSELTVTVTGVSAGDIINVSSTVNPANSQWTAYGSGADTATIRFNNYSGITLDPSSGTFKVKAIK